jgi:hypothetical protein
LRGEAIQEEDGTSQPDAIVGLTDGEEDHDEFIFHTILFVEFVRWRVSFSFLLAFRRSSFLFLKLQINTPKW